MLDMDELKEVCHPLARSSEDKTKHYAVVDRYNRYLSGWIGSFGIWGRFKGHVKFKTQKSVRKQIKMLGLEKNLRIVKVMADVKYTIIDK